MIPYHVDPSAVVYHGDCLDTMRDMPDACIDAIVTDPPYGLEFMGRGWDAPWRETDVNADAGMSTVGYTDGGIRLPRPSFTGSTNPKCLDCKGTRRGRKDGTAKVSVCLCVNGGRFPNVRAIEMRAFQDWCEAWARECLRVLKPGGYLLAFGGSRTWHRLAVAVEDAGFEIRDSIAWLTGSGFPKATRVNRDVRFCQCAATTGRTNSLTNDFPHCTNCGKPNADGYSTALKPAHEPCVVAQKPLSLSDILAKIGSYLDRLESSWQAQAAERATQTGAGGGSPGQTVTSWSEPALAMFSNTVTSWRQSWDDLCELTNTSTISTTSETTTVLKTCESYLSRLTVTNTLRSETSPPGLTSLASAVDALFASAVYVSLATRARSAAESATAATQAEHPDEADQGVSPAFEPIVCARKPLVGTVAGNVLTYGTGALNIDACRVETEELIANHHGTNGGVTYSTNHHAYVPGNHNAGATHNKGRWPTNVVLDESQAEALDAQTGTLRARGNITPTNGGGGMYGHPIVTVDHGSGDSGGASRFFPTFRYQAKAPASERPKIWKASCECADVGTEWSASSVCGTCGAASVSTAHATVKPLALMQWLVRLVARPGAVVLDPFGGSGTTAQACQQEGIRSILIEKETEYIPMIMSRLLPVAEFDAILEAKRSAKTEPS